MCQVDSTDASLLGQTWASACSVTDVFQALKLRLHAGFNQASYAA